MLLLATMIHVVLGGACALGGWLLTYWMSPEANQRAEAWRLTRWLGKGLLLPLVIWGVMNIGIGWELQPFMPAVQVAKNLGKGWAPIFFYVVALGFFLISSTWAATTLGWSLTTAWIQARAEVRELLKELYITWGLFLILPAVGIYWLSGWAALPLIAGLVLGAIAAYAPPILNVQRRAPAYSRAIAKLKFGKYSDAEWEIINELEKAEDDFQGWMMLAELYANQFHDIKGAERTVLEICTRPETTASELSVALHRLADWNLKFRSDLEGAKFALGLICERLPGTHLAHMAQLRIDQLPSNHDELQEQQGVRAPVRLPALGDSLDDQPAAPLTRAEKLKAAELANACVEKLEQDPKNIPAREKLARLFTERLGKTELGIEQLHLLLEVPDQSDADRAEWLSLIAAWNLKYLQDTAAARIALEQLTTEYPGTPQAQAGRRRLQLMAAAKAQPR